MSDPVTVAELRRQLGLSDGQLLTNSRGEHADLLAVDGSEAILGVLSHRMPIRVPIAQLLREKQ